MAFDRNKFLARFVDEAREHCNLISNGLLSLEQDPGDAEMLNSLFRSAHTIKGSARMMQFVALSDLAHHMEDVLDAVRGNVIRLNVSVSDPLFRALDSISGMLDIISATGKSGDAPEAILKELAKAATGGSVSDDTSKTQPEEPSAAISLENQETKTVSSLKPDFGIPSLQPVKRKPQRTNSNNQTEYYRINSARLDELISLMGEIVSEQGRFKKTVERFKEIEVSSTHFFSTLADSLKGDLDNSSREQLLENATNIRLLWSKKIEQLFDACVVKEHLVGELQESAMALRMLPMGTVFDSLRRTVRELARESGKDIDFIVSGGETELDRKIVEKIGDPLVHMIRNAIDHGLESPEERIKLGKPSKGKICLMAYFGSGRVTIAISDDGRGISLDKIRDRALAKKIFDETTIAKMTRIMLLDLLFTPGFSTSPIITELSGRGVGLDVVKKNIVEDLHGAIEIKSEVGVGTTFCLRLPITLAVSSLAILSVCGKFFAVAVNSIVELISVRKIDIIDIVNKRAVRIQDQIIPIVNLASVLGLHSDPELDSPELLLLIVIKGEEKLGLIIDDYLDKEDMIVKPLPKHIQNLRILTGVTVGVGGSVISVLNISELFQISRSLTSDLPGVKQTVSEKSATILVVDDSFSTREIEKSILEAYGYAVSTAEDGEAALKMTQNAMFDLVITDVEMPRLDGFSLTERLRADDRYKHIPVIIVTSRENASDKSRGIAVGADAYIIKGVFDQTNLLETVRNLIG